MRHDVPQVVLRPEPVDDVVAIILRPVEHKAQVALHELGQQVLAGMKQADFAVGLNVQFYANAVFHLSNFQFNSYKSISAF
ncbi:MAG: hypothetical protein C4542_07870 [Dehalococcoidia bacterium]|nr:MAG: hypothetical protein C4542_07870 [Dehalococcoidia bacterium]